MLEKYFYVKKIFYKNRTPHINIYEQLLFVDVFTIIPPRLTDPRNFITVLLVTREPEQTRFCFEARRVA